MSNKNNGTAAAPTDVTAGSSGGGGDSSQTNDKEVVLQVLKSGLCRVTEENIFNWNTNNNDRTDVELKPIFVPF